MTPQEFQDTLIAILNREIKPGDDAYEDFFESIKYASSFSDQGLMTQNLGVVIHSDNGSYQLQMIGQYR